MPQLHSPLSLSTTPAEKNKHTMRSRTLQLLLLLSVLVTGSSAATPPRKPKNSTPIPPPPLESIGSKRFSSSAVFPLIGNVYPHGLYYASMLIGNPPMPYFLDVDTGSDLTWLQCDAPCVSCSKGPHPYYRPAKNRLVPCEHDTCVSLHVSTGEKHACDSPSQCDYEITYADDWSSLGVLVHDAFALRLANTSIVHPLLAFGCGYDQQGTGANSPSPTDGVLGLGNGKSSILWQLRDQGVTKNVVGHCLSRTGGGYLFFGDDLVPPTGMNWAPMSQSALRKYYSPGKASLYFGKHLLAVKELPVVLDSGSSYTYFTNQPYQAFLSALKKDLNKTPLKEAFEDTSLPVCWKGSKPFKSVLDVKKYFRGLLLNFGSGRKAVQMEIPAENYLIITKHGNACLGILNGSEVELNDLNIIGDISMQDVMVVYDNEKERIGWVRTSCDRLPKSGTTPL
ncbi:aspartic proteinase Asp1-like [Iris pallida]|uniref:Aspartic proteinase Asp1 n=1 Tax=Iris pallida TaxID=29817 RepID=A0AAX6FX38_IRIPA|nr:aspartic proteinase Asp1-like [Iris pallida]KAJ6830179.1 aspartic proteinase Asp1-like [Iris pallida]